MPPASSSQYDRALRRGKAMSRAPSCSGTMKFAKPVQTGTTKRKTIVVPCIVKKELYCCAVRKPVSGVASWVRIPSASKPPVRKKKNVVTRYMTPIFLWSVVVIHSRIPV